MEADQTASIIEIEINGLVFLIDKNQRTASVIDFYSINHELIIPSTINHENIEYPVIRISKFAFKSSYDLKSLKFPVNSQVQIIQDSAFYFSEIRSIFIPASLTNLEEGWCNNAEKLNEIKISPKNPRYAVFDDKYIISKSSIEQKEYNVLNFCIRNIKIIQIPNFIEIISPYAFNKCESLEELSIPSLIKDHQSKAFHFHHV